MPGGKGPDCQMEKVLNGRWIGFYLPVGKGPNFQVERVLTSRWKES